MKVVKFPSEFFGMSNPPKKYLGIAAMSKLMPYCTMNIGPNTYKEEGLNLAISHEELVAAYGKEMTLSIVANEGMQRLLIDLSAYQLWGKNYYISKPLIQVLQNTKLENVKVSNLPKGFSSYQIKLATPVKDSHGGLAEDIFATIVEKKDKSGLHLNISWLDDSMGMGHFYYTLDYGKSIIDAIDSYAPLHDRQAAFKFLSLILNLLTYIDSNKSIFLEESNDFRGLKKIAKEREEKIYSSLPHYRFDIDVELVRLMTVKEFGVSGHFRWQPCGVGLSQVKLTFVRPHVRRRNNTSEINLTTFPSMR